MDLINAQTGKLEDVPDDQVHEAYTSGTHNLPTGSQVPILAPDGSYSLVDASQVDEVLKTPGTSIGSAGEAQAQQDKALYGGVGGQLAADAAGAARGLGAGLTDPLAIEAARAFGGDEAAEKTRQHLAGWERVNPIGSKISEVGGALVGALASGGEAAPEELAALGERAALRAERPLLSRALGYTPAGVISKVGRIAERAAGEVVGSPVATSALGRIAQAAARNAAAGSIETAIFGAGGQLSEDYLGKAPVTAEKVVAAMGHGALWGLLLGGAGGAGIEAAQPALRKAMPFLEKGGGKLAWEALGGTKALARSAEDLGGEVQVGKTVLEKLGLGEKGLHEAFLSAEKLAPKLDEAIAKQGKDIQALFEKHGVTGEVDLGPHVSGAEFDSQDLKLQAKNAGFNEEARADLLKMKADLDRLNFAKQVNAKQVETRADAGTAGVGSGFSSASVFHAVGNLAAGNPLGALKSVALGVGGKAIKDNGKMLAAATLTKISKMDFLARGINAADRDLIAAASTFGGKPAKERKERFSGPTGSSTPEARWKHAKDAGSSTTQVTSDHLEKVLPGLAAHTPKTAKSILTTVNMGSAYLAENKPKPLNKPTLTDPLPEDRVTQADSDAHFERVKAVQDPIGTLSEGVESGRLSQAQLAAIEKVYPNLVDDFRSKILDVLSKPHPDLSNDQVRTLEILFHGPGDELSDPVVANVLQASYSSSPANTSAQGGGKPAPSKIKPIENVGGASKTRLEQVQTRGN